MEYIILIKKMNILIPCNPLYFFSRLFDTLFLLISATGVYLKDESSNKTYLGRTQRGAEGNWRRKTYRGVLDINSLRVLEEKRDVLFVLSLLIHNTKPVGHQVLVPPPILPKLKK